MFWKILKQFYRASGIHKHYQGWEEYCQYWNRLVRIFANWTVPRALRHPIVKILFRITELNPDQVPRVNLTASDGGTKMVDVGSELLQKIRSAAVVSEPAEKDMQVRGPGYATQQGLLNEYCSPEKLQEVVNGGSASLGSLLAANQQMMTATATENDRVNATAKDMKALIENL